MTQASAPAKSETATRTNWHTQANEQVLAAQQVTIEQGLSEDEITRRREQYGLNELVERGLKSPWAILWEQFTGILVIVLIVAAALSLVLGDWEDALVIMVIVVLNAILGFVQEYRAEQAMAALKRMAAPLVRVRRGGQVQRIESKLLVPGDLILVEAGDAIPADARIVESSNLRVQEAALTGESEPVNKHAHNITGENLAIGDRRNMLYLGTAATYGHGLAVVVETGMRTELGRIAELIQTVETEKTPLQRRMEQLSKSLAIAALGIVVIVFVLGLTRGEAADEMFLTAVAMAVAVVPEGLPAVVTIALALGAQRMLQRRALIRKLPAVETLGSVTVICSDKTGTLTENRMSVRVLDVAGHTLEIEELTRSGRPVIEALEKRAVPQYASQTILLTGGALCNDAILESKPEDPGGFSVIGDPTEGALLASAYQFGLKRDKLGEIFPRVAEAPFSSERKRMTTVHKLEPDGRTQAILQPVVKLFPADGQYLAFTKGAVDGLLELITQVWVEDHPVPATPELKQRIESANNQMARDGLRVLGVCYRIIAELPDEEQSESMEADLTFVGMIGMMDPPRAEVKDAVALCRTAGIRPVMITGDHPLTALRIAKDLDIARGERVVTGQELAHMSVEDLVKVVDEVSVYARVSPEHKLNIVQALQSKGNVVAMTGDGVNDAPALRKSDIGVAMGITGTDVSKEAANMVILDDNFATIVKAVKEGRTIYDNVRRFIQYTMTSNAGEVYAMLFAPFLGLPFPLTALQILWVNLVTDGLPGLALAVEPSEKDVMERKPFAPNENIFGRGMGTRVLWVGLLMGLVSLGMGLWAYNQGLPHWQTMVFTTLTLSQMGHAIVIRSDRESIFSLGWFSNPALLGSVALTFVLQLLVIYWAPLQGMFETQALPLRDLLISLVLSTVVFWAVELEKWIVRLVKRRKAA